MTSSSSRSDRIVFDRYAPEDERRREALLALGNGLLSLRASAPESGAAGEAAQYHYAGLYRAGWYDAASRRINGEAVALDALVNLPNPLGLSFSLDGGDSWYNLESIDILDYRQTLTLSDGRLQRELTFRCDDGDAIRLDETRMVSMASPQLLILRWRLHFGQRRGSVTLRSVLDAGITNAAIARNAAYEGQRLQQLEPYHDDAGHAAAAIAPNDPARRALIATATWIDNQPAQWRTRRDTARLVQQADCAISADGAITVDKHVLVQVDEEIESTEDDPHGFRHAVTRLDALPDHADLVGAHRRAWQRLWSAMPLHADAPRLERALRFHAFHIVQTLSPHSAGHDLGFPPRGWQEGYFGQIFWDELFAVPFLASHFPCISRAIACYRHRRLDAARERARRAGLGGAMFPWRSARSGEEETPPYQFNPLSRHWMADYSYLQRHIGAAIAYNVWHHCLMSGDETLLAREGGELIVEIARFWASIVRFEHGRGRYVIAGVVGPDEYHNAYPGSGRAGFDNNAYTNVMAAWTLRCALELLERLPAAQGEALRRRLAVDDAELDRWDEVSRRIYVPMRDDGVICQFDGFDALKPPPCALRGGDHPRVDWLLEARGDSVDTYQLTKQADVLMLLHLFPPSALSALFARLGYGFGEADCRRTADYYLARITHESSLSKVVCAGALARLDAEASWCHFSASLDADLKAPAEDGVREGVHLGAMAATLDVLQRHYLGIAPTHDSLRLDPAPPPALDKVSLGFEYRGDRFTVALDGDHLELQAAVENRGEARLSHRDGSTRLAPGERFRLRCR